MTKLARLLVAGVLVFPITATTQIPQSSPFLSGLVIGPHAVGFQSFWMYDATRTWRSAYDERGARVSASPLRPIRINVWYPAARASSRTMTFGKYLGSARTAGFSDDERRVRTDDLGNAHKGLRGLIASTAGFDALMATGTLARRDAKAERGKFPIVIYSLGQGDYTQENTPLWEYLASRGYVVISVPGLGTSPRRSSMFVHDPPSYDNQVRDLAFALATVINKFPNADANHIAAMGHSMGGVYALMLAMRDSRIRTVVGLDPSFMAERPSYFYKYSEAPEYDALRFRGNLLAIYKGEGLSRAIVDSLRFTDRTLILVDSAVHADFNGYPAYSGHAPVAEVDSFALSRRPQATALATFAGIARYVACYLDDHLGVATDSKGGCSSIPRSVTEHEASMDGPTEEELYVVMKTRGVAAAKSLIISASSKGSHPGLRRNAMQRIVNELGYVDDSIGSANYASLMDAAFPEKH